MLDVTIESGGVLHIQHWSGLLVPKRQKSLPSQRSINLLLLLARPSSLLTMHSTVKRSHVRHLVPGDIFDVVS